MGKLKTLTAFLVGIVLVTVGFALNTFSATTPSSGIRRLL